MLHPSTKRLIDKLSEMTRKQRVAWSEGEDGTITHDTEGYRVVLTPEPHAVLLTDALGKEIESCSPEEFADETDAAGRPYASFVGELYREAHRHARGAEKAINTVLKGLETIDEEPEEAPAPALDRAELVEDLGDDTDAFPEAYPELEGQTDMARAVASMAEEVNGGVREPKPEPEPEIETVEDVEASAPEPEPFQTAETDATPYAEPDSEPETAAEQELEAQADPESEMEAIEDAPEESAAQALAPFEYTPAFAVEPDHPADAATISPAEPETIEAEASLWPEDENAPVLETAPEPVTDQPTPEPQPEPEAEAAPTASISSSFGTGYFGSGASGLAAYMSPPPAAAEPDPAPQPEPVAPEVDYAAEAASDAPHIDLPDETPVPDDAPEAPLITETAPVAPQELPRFSLSGMSSGFGLGSAGRPGPMAQDSSPASQSPAVEPKRMVIDGTVDLPDEIDMSEFSAGPDVPAYADPVADAESAPFTFKDRTDTPPAAPETSRPEEKAFEVPAETVQPGTAEPEAEEAPAAPKAPTRFNPWN